ncbi:hypothetical protein PUNSTDRAFT_122178 [Punctularia strigosozonata HHB-11173 SS5]|uniref:uncharacterized protein n=1 Tax=Punctularia strigosozonata (strain HHB-11173) TaxID=741275 RepID=UPI0004416D68|nr:uncharacterized protein PUNSTDRAFT_122178 [Punctularia strigosozonata HHB-11173 SS5]EIN05714.1 hypothetical protein PUNSTDRAFT_122178 [Punctularia strigosozonata HHB-11173 SS5]
MSIVLSSCSSLLCQDRFSLVDSDEAEVPFWSVLEVILQEPVVSADDDLDGLKAHVCSSPDDERRFCSTTWRALVALALEMPVLYASREPFTGLEVCRTAEATTHSRFLGLDGGAAVISANRFIGFGCGGTQEEAMVNIVGYGRSAWVDPGLGPDGEVNGASSDWTHGTMLFMDALELDQEDYGRRVRDLLPGHIDRELSKCATAFSSYDSAPGPYRHISTGLWGCGAFGGDPQIKTVIQWAAASLAGAPLRFVCQDEAFAASLESFVQSVRSGGWSVGQVLTCLREHYD